MFWVKAFTEGRLLQIIGHHIYINRGEFVILVAEIEQQHGRRIYSHDNSKTVSECSIGIWFMGKLFK